MSASMLKERIPQILAALSGLPQTEVIDLGQEIPEIASGVGVILVGEPEAVRTLGNQLVAVGQAIGGEVETPSVDTDSIISQIADVVRKYVN